MKIDDILHVKGADVFRVPHNVSIREAVTELGARNIGAVIVVDSEDNLTGILSERDVVRELGKRGATVLDMKVGDCMTANPYTCTGEATVNDILERMTNHRIRHMPVLKDGRISGLVSIGDIVKRKIDETEQEAEALKEYIAT